MRIDWRIRAENGRIEGGRDAPPYAVQASVYHAPRVTPPTKIHALLWDAHYVRQLLKLRS